MEFELPSRSYGSPLSKQERIMDFHARSGENQQGRLSSGPNTWPKVTIEVLRINGRPVSFAKFRRIPCEPIAGRCLGWVNYLWGRCARRDKRGHLHVLWLTGDGELRRACV